MAPLIPILGLAAAGLIGYKVLGNKPRFVGDLAKAGPLGTGPNTGDQVEVMVPDLLRANASLSMGPAGLAAGQLPPGTQTVIIHVLGATKDVLQGPMTTVGTLPLPAPVGTFVVPRQDVKAVYRNGKTARAADGKFAGERHRRFAG